MAEIIDGVRLAGKIKEQAKESVAKLGLKGIKVNLTVLLVGEDPASAIYVKNKEKDCSDVGISSETMRLPTTISEKELISLVDRLNKTKGKNGILVQLPLPRGINEKRVLENIDPNKDVDGLHPINMGRLLKDDNPPLVACTPKGIIELILSTGQEIKGREAVIVGRSNIVGKPVAILLLQNHATVTLCHSRTVNLDEATRRADILVAAVGSQGIIHGEMIKKGAIVIDVGTSRVGGKWLGDVDFESAKERAGYITPVPGGVGPMTRAMLLMNTIKAAELAAG